MQQQTISKLSQLQFYSGNIPILCHPPAELCVWIFLTELVLCLVILSSFTESCSLVYLVNYLGHILHCTDSYDTSMQSCFNIEELSVHYFIYHVERRPDANAATQYYWTKGWNVQNPENTLSRLQINNKPAERWWVVADSVAPVPTRAGNIRFGQVGWWARILKATCPLSFSKMS